MEIPAINTQLAHQSALLQGSNGMSQLTDAANWLARRQGNDLPGRLTPAIVLFAADHDSGATINYSEQPLTTAQRLQHALSEKSIISHLAREADAELRMLNLGINGAVEGCEQAIVREGGAADICTGSAMDEVEYWEAVGIGEEAAIRAVNEGANLLVACSLSATNRISVAALICELAGIAPEEALGGGMDPKSFAEEMIALESALERAQGTPSNNLLRELGGLELAAMAGFYRAAARLGVPVLLDGKQSAAAALAAVAWDVRISGWIMASFVSKDAAHNLVLEELGLEPLMQLQHDLSGGKGAALLLPLLQAASTLQRGLAVIDDIA